MWTTCSYTSGTCASSAPSWAHLVWTGPAIRTRRPMASGTCRLRSSASSASIHGNPERRAKERGREDRQDEQDLQDEKAAVPVSSCNSCSSCRSSLPLLGRPRATVHLRGVDFFTFLVRLRPSLGQMVLDASAVHTISPLDPPRRSIHVPPDAARSLAVARTPPRRPAQAP